MSKVIIGIHGMGNKPERKQLEKWWKAAIHEGLEKTIRYRFIRFQLVYWASIIHEKPIKISDLKEPYQRGMTISSDPVEISFKRKVRDEINNQIDNIFLEKNGSLNFTHLTDFILKHFAGDLDRYYNGTIKEENKYRTRELVCEQLSEKLFKNRRKKIMLIAHSMGSIIAWDVLNKYVPDIGIDTLVTIGSPLGLPFVRGRLLMELANNEGSSPILKTPENIRTNWFNLSDFRDRVAMSYDLRNDFLPNSRHIQPMDMLVENNYIFDDKSNHHKSYGYLRCREMSRIISDFSRIF